MSEPVGIGTGRRRYPCSGNPNRPGAVLNDCGKEARWAVIATLPVGEGGKPGVVIITTCDSHLLGVKGFLRDQAAWAALERGEEFTEDDEPMVDSVKNLGKLEEQFGQVWLAQPGSA
jgi:hypothetical protein